MKKKRSSAGYFWMAFGLSALVTLISFIVIGIWPFGDNTALKVDSLHQYLPFYTDFYRKLRSGEDLFYSFSAGLGYDFWSTFAYYIACPLNFLVALVPMANVCDFMDLVILLKIALCGGTFAWYLSKRRKNADGLCVVFGLMFATSNFIVGYYFNLMWLDSMAMLPLIMYGIEQIVKGRSGRTYALALFYGLWCNYYIGFMLCLFSVLYLFVCFLQQRGLTLKSFALRCVRFGWHSLLAGGMSAVLLLPAYLSLRASESMEDNSFPSVIKFYTGFVDMIKTHFAAQAPINISDSQVGLNAYCGVIVLILVILYVLDEHIPVRRKLSHLLLTGFVMLSFSMNILNYMWHGFHQQNGLPNRFAFIYIALILIMGYDVWEDLKTMAAWKILIGGLIPLLFSLWLVMSRQTDWEAYGAWNYLTPVLLGVYLLCILLQRFSIGRGKVMPLVLALLMTAEAAGHDIYGFCQNGSVTRSIYLKDQASFKTLTKPEEADTFYRAEIDSQRMRNVTMFAGGHSMVLFNSTMDAAYTRFCDEMGIEARTNKNGYNGVTRLMNDIFGIRYVLASIGRADTLYQFTKENSDGNLTMYRNDEALSLGFMCNPEIRYFDPVEGDPIANQNSFVMLATGLDELYTLDRVQEVSDGETQGVRIPEGKQVYLYLPSRVSSFKLDTPEYQRTWTTYTDHLYTVSRVGENDQAEFTVSLNSYQSQASVKIYTCPDEKRREVIRALSESQLEQVQAAGRHVTGSIQADRDGILLLTIPYDTDWSVKVDGSAVETMPIGGALTGLELKAGEHTITMTYTPRGLYAGLIISLISLILWLVTIYLEKKKDSKDRERKDTMNIQFSQLAQSFKPGIFSILNEKKEALEQQGMKIHNLSVGTPDFPVPEAVRKAVEQAAADPNHYKYSLKDMPELIGAMQDFYRRRFGVALEAEEIMTVNGSQEGIAHFSWTLCDPGDIVLVPNPGYPIFKVGPTLCGAKVWEYPLTKENGYLPKFDEIPENVLEKAKYMIISYPGNPLCVGAPDAFYREAIAFARQHDIVLVHDNAYADIDFTPSGGRSFLSFEGAKEVGVEFYSLSKTFDYTGARLSFLLGNAEILAKFRAIRSQIDYGVFYPIQYGAIAALHEPDENARAQCRQYEERSRAFTAALREIGWDVPDTDGTMFVWAPLPQGYTDSESFCLTLMEKAGVICTPGISFGSLGEGHVRFALVESAEQLREAARAIGESGIIG